MVRTVSTGAFNVRKFPDELRRRLTIEAVERNILLRDLVVRELARIMGLTQYENWSSDCRGRRKQRRE